MKNKSSLNDLKSGDTAIIHSLTATGGIRQRLQDIGFIPGTRVECIGSGPLGDPVAYLVRGTMIALRSEDSEKVIIN